MEVCILFNDVCNNIKMFVYGVKNKKVYYVKNVYYILMFKNEVCKEGIILYNKKSICYNDEVYVIIIIVYYIMVNVYVMIINEYYVLVNVDYIF